MSRDRLRTAALSMLMQPRQWARTLSQLAGGTGQGETVLSVDGQWLKVLQVEGPRSARRIARIAAAPVAGPSADELFRSFEDLCRVEGLTPREVVLANPTHLSTIRLFSLPSTDPKEIKDIVDLQAEKHTPYAKDEVIADFKVLDRDRSGYSRVLLVIAHQDVVQRPTRLIERARLPLDKVAAELEGLIAWAAARRRSGAPAVTLVADVDASTTTLLILHQQQPVFHRSLATGAEQMTDDAAGAGQRMVTEIQRSLEALETEAPALKVQEVLVTGPIEQLEPLRAALEAGLQLPVRLVPPWDGAELSPAAQAARARLPHVSFAGLVGLAFSDSAVNLTPHAMRLRQAFEARAQALVLLGCQFVGALILVSLLIIARAQQQQQYYRRLQTLHQSVAQEAGAVEQALHRLQLVQGQLHNRGALLNVVEQIAVQSPPGIQWDSLVFTQGEAVVLRGTSGELPKVYEFADALRGTGLFAEVEASRVAKRAESTAGVTDFELRCRFSAPAP